MRSNILWNFKAKYYEKIREHPLILKTLTSENNAIISLIDELPVKDFNRVLDIGVGGGNSISILPNTDNIVGIDTAYLMLKETKKRYPGNQYVLADATVVPFKKNSFDLITCIGVIEYLKYTKPLLSAICSVLKSDGYLIITSSPFHPLTFLRILSGHMVYGKKDRRVEPLFSQYNLTTINKSKTLIQSQYLLKKVG